MNQNAFLFSHFFFLTYADFYFCSFLAFPLPTASLHSSLFSGRKASVEKDTFAALLQSHRLSNFGVLHYFFIF